MIDKIFPGTVSTAERFGYASDAILFPQEQAVVAHTSLTRMHEFATARECARDALAGLGFASAPIMPGPGGAPQWPPGVVGSITHATGYSAAAVARARDVLTLGLDAEPHAALPAGVLGQVAAAEEREGIVGLTAARPDINWDRVLFSAKESVYKAWFPLTHEWLGFGDAVITVDPAAMAFTVRLLVPTQALPAAAAFCGRCIVGGDLILTSVVVPS